MPENGEKKDGEGRILYENAVIKRSVIRKKHHPVSRTGFRIPAGQITYRGGSSSNRRLVLPPFSRAAVQAATRLTP